MKLLDAFLAQLAPHDCIGCEAEGQLVCLQCSSRLAHPAGRCYRCHRVAPDGRTCVSCRRVSRLYTVQAAVLYEDIAKALVWRLKFGSTPAAATEMARQIARLCALDGESALIVPVPTATSRIRRRGYDQAQLIAKELCRIERLLYINCLRRLGQHQQVGASRQERLSNLGNAFRLSGESVVKGAHIILIDDVITTGATLEAAAALLSAAGAKRVEAVVFARA